MVETINEFLNIAVTYIWGLPMVFALLGAGLFFTISLGLIQLKGFKHAIHVIIGKYTSKDDEGEISHFQALTTALSATIGLGNIAGVAVAITRGGPGAAFWMIVTGFLGMATKYAESTLSIKYRKIESDGSVHGGPMYYILNGMGPKFKPLALFFAVAAIFGSFGAPGMFQTNQVASIFKANFDVSPWITGLIISVLTAVVIIGGIKRIANVTSYLIPFMAGIYILGCLVVIFMNLPLIPSMFVAIITDAFTGTAAVGAFEGVVVREVFVHGVRRACFSNEAGMGSSPIAHAAATTKEPVREGVVALLEPFVDTVVVCTMTALVILLSGVWQQPNPGDGSIITAMAFNSAIPGFGQYFIPVAVFLFAYSTMISWSYYGQVATSFIFGPKSILYYNIAFCVLSFIGSIWSLTPIISFSDIMFGLMAVPNLFAIIYLSKTVRTETQKYFSKLKNNEFTIYK